MLFLVGIIWLTIAWIKRLKRERRHQQLIKRSHEIVAKQVKQAPPPNKVEKDPWKAHRADSGVWHKTKPNRFPKR